MVNLRKSNIKKIYKNRGVLKQIPSGISCMKDLNPKECTLGIVVLICLFGLIGFSIVDKDSRPAFLDVAKVSIGAFVGYLIPDHE